MRIGFLLLIVLATVAGCQKKPQGPKTTSIEPPIRTAEQLHPEPEPAAYSEPILPPAQTYSPPAATIPAPSHSPSSTAKTYTVRRGDTGFMSIARNELGDVTRWREIRDLNPGVDTTDLKIGQKLQIPAR